MMMVYGISTLFEFFLSSSFFLLCLFLFFPYFLPSICGYFIFEEGLHYEEKKNSIIDSVMRTKYNTTPIDNNQMQQHLFGK